MVETLTNGFRIPAGQGLPDRIVLGGHKTAFFGQLAAALKKFVPANGTQPLSGSEYFSERIVMPDDPSDIDALRALLGHDRNTVLFLFLETPVAFIARALNKGRKITDAAQEWHAVADRLLCLAEQHDERVSIFVSEAIACAPDEMAKTLSRKYDFPLAYDGGRTVPERELWEDFYMLVANRYLSDRSDLSGVNEGIVTRAESIDLARAVTADWSRAFRVVEQMREESRLLLDHLHWLQVQYESTFLRLQKQEDTVAQLRGKAAEQERLVVESEKRLNEARKKIEEGNKRLERMRRSTSWRITLPIRVVSRLIRWVLGK